MATHPLKGPLISFPRYAEDMKVPTRMVRRWPYPVSCRSCRQLDGSALFRYWECIRCWEKFLRLLRTVCEANFQDAKFKPHSVLVAGFLPGPT